MVVQLLRRHILIGASVAASKPGKRWYQYNLTLCTTFMFAAGLVAIQERRPSQHSSKKLGKARVFPYHVERTKTVHPYSLCSPTASSPATQQLLIEFRNDVMGKYQ